MGPSSVGSRPPPPPPPATAARPPAAAPAAQAPKQSQAEKDVISTAKGTKLATTVANVTQTGVKSGTRALGPIPLSQTASTVTKTPNNAVTRGAGAVGLAANVAQLPGAVKTASQDVRAAFRDPSDQTVNKAVGSTASAASRATSVAKDGLTLAGNVSNYRAARSAATTAVRAAAPEAAEATVKAASKAATSAALSGASRQVTRAAVRGAAGTGSQVAATAARAALRGGGTSIAKAAGRFAPGANVAIAALDTASAVSTLRDPNASTGKKVTSVITAAGSIAAATNIPVVSQAGAVVSGISSFVGSFF